MNKLEKKIIDFSEYFLVLNENGFFYSLSDDGYFDGFVSDIHSATIFNNSLFFQLVSSGAIDFDKVSRLYVFNSYVLEISLNSSSKGAVL